MIFNILKLSNLFLFCFLCNFFKVEDRIISDLLHDPTVMKVFNLVKSLITKFYRLLPERMRTNLLSKFLTVCLSVPFYSTLSSPS